jgi:DNA mismatch repair protein MutL
VAETRHIHVLPAEVAERIAAGEVVDRPASVVRELIDNALDAGAHEVVVELEAGGLGLIRVADDGAGIPADEVELALARHATSKIREVDDLQRLRTLGFRGEALPSMAAVAELTLVSRQADAPTGSLVAARGGRCVRREPAARQPGTTVTVRRLFYNVPARLKLLGPERGEAAQVAQLVRAFALARPDVRFALHVDGRPSFASAGTGDARGAATDVFGPEVASALRPLVVDPPAASSIRLDGYLTARTVTRPDRRQLVLVINGRRTATPGLLDALEAAYRPFLPRGRHPIGLLRLEVPPEEVDPNVHPAKSEVRLLREGEVAERLTAAVRETLGRVPDRPGALDDFALAPNQLTLPRPRHRIAEPAEPAWGEVPIGAALRDARALTQVLDTLVLVESAGGLYAVDQHRAHERVIYERLQRRLADAGLDPGQALLEPLVLELTPHQTLQLEGRLEVLRGLGLDCQRFGGHVFLVRSVPASLVGAQDALGADAGAPAPGEELAGVVHEALEVAAAPDDRWQARLMANLSCRAAVRRQRRLGEPEMRRLIGELSETANPAACPHGSPVALHFTGAFWRRQFRW